MTDDVFTPTPASAWVDPNPAREVTLPSGNCAIVKKPNLYILGRTGQVPQKVAAAQKRTQKAKQQKAVAPGDAVDALDDFEIYVDWLVTRCFVSPVVTIDGAGGTLPLSALTSEDKRFVLEAVEAEV